MCTLRLYYNFHSFILKLDNHIIIMSLVKLLSGRKRDSLLWDFFTYDAGCDKSSCMVVDDKTKLECGAKITGKNTSNLGSHLKRHHKDAHEQYRNKEKLKEAGKQGVKRTSAGVVKPIVPGNAQKFKHQTLGECLQRRVVAWPKDSTEHRQRVQSVMNVIASTGYPVTIVDEASFRGMIGVLDPKFKMPGWLGIDY